MNGNGDVKEKVIDKIRKLKAQSDGEAKLGNTAAAEAFASMINKLLLKHDLTMTEADYEKEVAQEEIVELAIDFDSHGVKHVRRRVPWQQTLAVIVAKAHMCRILVRAKSNKIWFVGTKSHAVVAEYAFGTLVAAADRMSIKARLQYANERERAGGQRNEANGFREAWLHAFVTRISERFDEAKRAMQNEVASTALMRIDTALVRVNQYMGRFSGRLGHIGMDRGDHAEASRRGRDAANSIALGRKGVGSGNQGLLN